MTDYELYGEYNQGEEADNGAPPPHPVWAVFARAVQIVCIILLVGTLALLGFRIVLSWYYPKGVSDLYYTEALADYAEAGGDMSALTQEIRVPFEGEIINSDGSTLMNNDQRNGYYCADNLIVVKGAGAVQFTIRINRSNVEEIGREYGLERFEMKDGAFAFVLEDDLGNTYTPSKVFYETHALYHYIKVCYDGVALDGVSWMRAEIAPAEADREADSYLRLAVVVYENHEYFHTFTEYKLSKRERWGE